MLNSWITTPEVARAIEDMQRQRAEVELQTAQLQLVIAQHQERKAKNEERVSEIALDFAVEACKRELSEAKARGRDHGFG